MSIIGNSLKGIKIEVWGILATLFVAAVGGAYYLGKENASAKFDLEKNNLYDDNQKLKLDTSILRTGLTNARDSIRILQNHVKVKPDTTSKSNK